MATTNKRTRVVNSAYTKWTENEKQNLIESRIKLDHLFAGKNANQRDGWIQVSRQIKKSPEICRQQWQSLIRKYKSISAGNSGDGANDDGPALDSTTWPFYCKINEYAIMKHNFFPPATLSNADGFEVRDTRPETSMETSTITLSALSEDVPSTSRASSRPSSSNRTPPQLTMFEKKNLKSTKKMDKKVSSLMSVLGQMVQHDYPNIDVSELLVLSDSSDEE